MHTIFKGVWHLFSQHTWLCLVHVMIQREGGKWMEWKTFGWLAMYNMISFYTLNGYQGRFNHIRRDTHQIFPESIADHYRTSQIKSYSPTCTYPFGVCTTLLLYYHTMWSSYKMNYLSASHRCWSQLRYGKLWGIFSKVYFLYFAMFVLNYDTCLEHVMFPLSLSGSKQVSICKLTPNFTSLFHLMSQTIKIHFNPNGSQLDSM